MAGVAARLAVVQLPSALRRVGDRLRIAIEEAIDRRVERDDGAFEAGDRLADARDVDRRAAECLLEQGAVFGDPRELLFHGRMVGHRHLDRIDDRLNRLSLQCRRAPVPKLLAQERGIEHRRGVAHSLRAADAVRDRLPVGEAGARIVTSRTRDRVVFGKTRIEVQLPAEVDFVAGEGVVGRDLRRQDALGHRERELLSTSRRSEQEQKSRDQASQAAEIDAPQRTSLFRLTAGLFPPRRSLRVYTSAGAGVNGR